MRKERPSLPALAAGKVVSSGVGDTVGDKTPGVLVGLTNGFVVSRGSVGITVAGGAVMGCSFVVGPDVGCSVIAGDGLVVGGDAVLAGVDPDVGAAVVGGTVVGCSIMLGSNEGCSVVASDGCVVDGACVGTGVGFDVVLGGQAFKILSRPLK